MTLRPFLLSVPVLLAASVGTGARAVPVIVNGNFETTSLKASAQMNTTNVGGWSTTGYNFLFLPGTATTTGAATVQYGQLYLGGSTTAGASNYFPASSPSGGNFAAADGDFGVGPITQTVTGLTAGLKYSLSFYWAAAQQRGYAGTTTEQWKVSLGSEMYATPVVTNPNQGFSGWFAQTFTYTATSASQVLSFLAVGTPVNAPPFLLLDGVSITAVAEPASWMTLVIAMLSIVGVANLRHRSSRLARLAAVNGDAQPARAGHAKPRRRRRRSYAHASAC